MLETHEFKWKYSNLGQSDQVGKKLKKFAYQKNLHIMHILHIMSLKRDIQSTLYQTFQVALGLLHFYLLLQLETEVLSSNVAVIFSHFLISFSIVNQPLFLRFCEILVSFMSIFLLFLFFFFGKILIPFAGLFFNLFFIFF